MNAAHDDPQAKRRITLQLPNVLVERLDQLRREWGLRSRGDAVERLIGELLSEPGASDGAEASDGNQDSRSHASPFDEAGALVLVSEHLGGGLAADFEDGSRPSTGPASAHSAQSSPGIDLPGFVRRQSEQLRQSLNVNAQKEQRVSELMPLVSDSDLAEALQTAQRHWLELYGTAPNDNVLEASMQWLGKDIWPQAEQSDGRPFTWSLACRTALDLAPSWPPGQPSFDKVMALAGLLEDPFSAATLSMRIPTLIRRFVHRMRRRQRGTSFETLENTMSLHGALKLLHLPTAPGHRLTLTHIREAYRDQAMQHHPDSGGSAEQMRRLNEAYQLLKELYRAA